MKGEFVGEEREGNVENRFRKIVGRERKEGTRRHFRENECVGDG